MSNNPWDRTVINPRERPLSTDINQAQSQGDRALREVLSRAFSKRTSIACPAAAIVTGFLGDGFCVRPQSPIAAQVVVKAGVGFVYAPADVPAAIGGVVGVDDLCPYKPLVLLSDAVFTVPGLPLGGGLSRIDVVEVKVDRRLENPLSRDVLDPSTGSFSPTSVNKTLAFYLDGRTGQVSAPAPSTAGLSYKVGVAGVAPADPGTTSGYVRLGTIYLGPATTTIDETELLCNRKLLFSGGMASCGVSWTQDNAATPKAAATVLNTPPGVRVCLNGTSMAQGYLYVVMGDLASIPVAGLVGGVSNILANWGGINFAAGTVVAVNAGLQTLLADPLQTSPATKVAVGTNVAQFLYSLYRWSAPNIIAADVASSPRANFTVAGL